MQLVSPTLKMPSLYLCAQAGECCWSDARGPAAAVLVCACWILSTTHHQQHQHQHQQQHCLRNIIASN
jgi:hypothetical protein